MSERLEEIVPETGSPENGHGRTAPSTPQRLEILPSGARLIRLGPHDGPGWLREYDWILRRAAEDFLKRSKVPGGIPEGVLARLWNALEDPDRQAVWLVLDPAYRLIGFAWIAVDSLFGGAPTAIVPAMYLYPPKRARVFGVLVERMCAWARAQGAVRVTFETRRDRPRAWARIAATPVSTVYERRLNGGP